MAKDIVQTATDAGSFTTLLAAVKAAGLVETLQGTGPFTVFAPTDAAFAALPAGTLDGLLKLTRRSEEDPAVSRGLGCGHRGPGCRAYLGHVGRGVADRHRRQGRDGLPERQREGRHARRDGIEWRHPRHRPGHPAARDLIHPNLPACRGWGLSPSGPTLVPMKDAIVIASNQLDLHPDGRAPSFASRLPAALEHRAWLRPRRPGRRRPRARHRLRVAGHGDVHGGAAGHYGRRADHPVRGARGGGRRPLPPAVGRIPLARGAARCLRALHLRA